jgi:hypothetical protein
MIAGRHHAGLVQDSGVLMPVVKAFVSPSLLPSDPAALNDVGDGVGDACLNVLRASPQQIQVMVVPAHATRGAPVYIEVNFRGTAYRDADVVGRFMAQLEAIVQTHFTATPRTDALPKTRRFFMHVTDSTIPGPSAARFTPLPDAPSPDASAPHAMSAAVALRSIDSFHVNGEVRTLSGLPVEQRVLAQGAAARPVDPNGDHMTGQMYCQAYRLAEPRHALPVLLWHGGGMTGTNWETTPDGRQGWLWRFLQAGYDVIVSDGSSEAGHRGRASRKSMQVHPFSARWMKPGTCSG